MEAISTSLSSSGKTRHFIDTYGCVNIWTLGVEYNNKTSLNENLSDGIFFHSCKKTWYTSQRVVYPTTFLSSIHF